MVTLDWQLDRAGGVTLVELFVTSTRDCRVEIESALQPVWPPRRHNRPVAGWTDSGFEAAVAAETGLVLGYASPAAPVEPPATVVGTEPIAAESGTPTPGQLVQSLGEAAPPRDAVPAGATDRSTPGVGGERSATPDSRPDSPESGSEPASDARTSGNSSAATHSNEPSHTPTRGTHSDGESRSGTPHSAGESRSGTRSSRVRERSDTRNGGVATRDGGVAAWLDGVERRLGVAEELAAVETAAEARAAVTDAGGIEAVRELCAQLDDDREGLAQLEAAELDRRLAAVDIPLSALERLA